VGGGGGWGGGGGGGLVRKGEADRKRPFSINLKKQPTGGGGDIMEMDEK